MTGSFEKRRNGEEKKKERNDKEFAQFGGLGQTESALDQG